MANDILAKLQANIDRAKAANAHQQTQPVTEQKSVAEAMSAVRNTTQQTDSTPQQPAQRTDNTTAEDKLQRLRELAKQRAEQANTSPMQQTKTITNHDKVVEQVAREKPDQVLIIAGSNVDNDNPYTNIPPTSNPQSRNYIAPAKDLVLGQSLEEAGIKVDSKTEMRGRCKATVHYKRGTNIIYAIELDSTDDKPLRVLKVTDMHLKDQDPKTIDGYVTVNDMVLDELEEVIIRERIDIVMFLGDLTDRGFAIQAKIHHYQNRLTKLKELLDGNLYLVIGNHPYLALDTNPEMYWVQPSDILVPQVSVKAYHPILEAPYIVRVNCCQYDLQHYRKDMDKRQAYFRPVVNKEKVRYRHGLWHDEDVLPSHVRAAHHIFTTVQGDFLIDVLGVYDHGTCGHIHTPYDPITMVLPNGHKLIMDVPGSMTITTSDESQRHGSVLLPIDELTNMTYQKTYVKCKTYIERYMFKNKQQEIIKKLEKEEQEQVISKMAKRQETVQSVAREYATERGLFEYATVRGSSQVAIDVLRRACSGTLTKAEIVKAVTMDINHRSRNTGAYVNGMVRNDDGSLTLAVQEVK